MSLRPVLVGLLLLAAGGGAGAATVYRCGNAYADLPCADARSLLVTEALTPSQRAEARRVAQDEKTLAAEMARDRRAQEAAMRPAIASSLSAPAVVEKTPPAKKAPKARKKKHLTPDDERDFIAAVPRCAGREASAPRRRAQGLAAGTGAQRLGLQAPVLRPQGLARLDVRRIDRNAGDGADLHALRLVEVADALGALARVDDVDRLAHRDRRVGALGLADVAVDALVGDDQRQDGFRTGEEAPAAPVARARRA